MIRAALGWVWGTSIRRQLVVGVALVHLLLMSIFVFDIVQRQKEFLLERTRQRALHAAELLAASSLHGMLSHDLAGLGEILTSLARDGTIEYAMVTDPRGQVLAHTDPARAGRFLQDPSSLAVLLGAVRAQRFGPEVTTIRTAAPIVAHGRHVGWAWVAGDLSDVRAHLVYVTRAGLFYTVIAILVGTLFAVALARAILRPLRLLLAATDRVSRNQLDEPIPETTRNEVGRVARAFNAMAAALRARDEETRQAQDALAALTRNLEAEVDHRTRELERQRTHLEAILAGMGEGVCVVDTAGRVLVWNSAAERINRVAAADIIGTTFPGPLRIDPGVSSRAPGSSGRDERWEVWGAIAPALAEQPGFAGMRSAGGMGGPSRPPMSIVRPDGTEVAIAMTAAPVRDGTGAVVGGVAVFRDVTREMEIDRMKSEFVSTVSHELRTPLTSIRAYAETLREMVDPQSTVYEFLLVIEGESVRLTRLINDLLTISRIESGRVQFRHEPGPLEPLVELAVRTAQPKARAAGVEIAVEIPADLPPFRGDQDGVQQVLTNLVDNAVKYNCRGGCVTVRAWLDGGVGVEVRDSGIGMSAAAVRQLGDRFFRVDSSATRKIGGTGLGMTLVKEILAAHGAQLEVESIEGKGTAFRFVLPLAGGLS